MSEQEWVDFLSKFIGTPFQWNARGPEKFDCWGVVLHVLERLGVEQLPDFVVEESDAPDSQVCVLIEQQIETGSWQRIDDPQPGDVVAMSSHRRIHHVGVVTPFGILNTTKAMGAILTKESRLRTMGYRRIEYYRWVK